MLDRLRDTHRILDERTSSAARSITDLAATMQVLESADEGAIEESFDASHRTLAALESFLDALAELVDAADSGSVEREDLRELVRELEPLPGPDPGGASQPKTGAASDVDEPERPFTDIPPLRRLSAPYSVLLNLERDLYAERIRRPFRVRKLKELWGDLSRAGSAHPNEGLVARLGRLAEYFVDDRASHSSVPWSDGDRSIVADLASRAAEIRDWERETVEERERQRWVERVRDWVETAEEEPESVPQMREMLTRFLTDLPRERKPDVRMLLERIVELDQLPSDLRERTERFLEQD